MSMELYATGFNAWHQLDINKPHQNEHNGVSPLQSTQPDLDDPEDIQHFTLLLRDETISHVKAGIYCTEVKTSLGLQYAGYPQQSPIHKNVSSAHVVNGADVTADILPNGRIVQWQASQSHPTQEFALSSPVKQLVAYQTGFAALTADGQVFTWGDSRYSGCLGREVSASRPADIPAKVTALDGLSPIRKIAAGGYSLAVLTEDDDLYLWGQHIGNHKVNLGLSHEPTPVVIDEQDILDVGVGHSHIIVLTLDQKLFVVGDNMNGQLGLPIDSASTWTHVKVPTRGDQMIVGVAAGPRNSFVTLKQK